MTIEPHNSKALALVILSQNGSFHAEFVSITAKQTLKIGPRLAPYDLRWDMRAHSVRAAPRSFGQKLNDCIWEEHSVMMNALCIF